jgi:hypothetical protein
MSKKNVSQRPAELIEGFLTSTFGNKFVYFREYKGRRPKHTWNRKPIVGPPDRPFAELQMVERLEKERWIAGWCHRPGQFISTWEPEKRAVQFPAAALALLEKIAAKAGANAGCWDVFAWKDGKPRFVELKRMGSSDKLRASQERWRAAAIELGVPSEAFLEMVWLGGSLDGYSLKAMECIFDQINSWVRYRDGRIEFGGQEPRDAESWFEAYRRDTGLQGADLVWVLFRDNTSGATCWDIKQTKDRGKGR